MNGYAQDRLHAHARSRRVNTSARIAVYVSTPLRYAQHERFGRDSTPFAVLSVGSVPSVARKRVLRQVSLALGAGGLHYLAPLHGFAPDERRERRRGTRGRLEIGSEHFLALPGFRDDACDLGVEELHDLARRARGRHDTVPDARLVAW